MTMQPVRSIQNVEGLTSAVVQMCEYAARRLGSIQFAVGAKESLWAEEASKEAEGILSKVLSEERLYHIASRRLLAKMQRVTLSLQEGAKVGSLIWKLLYFVHINMQSRNPSRTYGTMGYIVFSVSAQQTLSTQ